MSFYKPLLGVVGLLFACHVSAQPVQTEEAAISEAEAVAESLAIKYSDTYGWISVLLESAEAIDRQCDTHHALNTLKNEADYLLRTKTGYSYLDWGTEVADPRFQAAKVNQAVKSIMESIGGCDKKKLEQVAKISSEKVQHLLLEMVTYQDLDYFEIIDRGEKEVRAKLNEKLNDFTNLSLEEAEYIVEALETGSYRYALHNPPIAISVDKVRALELKSALEHRKLAIN